MISIEYILSLLDCNNTAEKTEEGLELARKVECIRVFFCPKGKRFNKNVWNNCAQIISEKSDEDLERYLYEMFLWILTKDAPGGDKIFERLVSGKWFAFDYYYQRSLNYSRKTGDIKGEQTLLLLHDKKKKENTFYVYREDDTEQRNNCLTNSFNAAKQIGMSDHIIEILKGTDKEYDHTDLENCAKQICEKTDDELSGCICALMMWLKSMKTPGADVVYNRLRCGEWKSYNESHIVCFKEAEDNSDKEWQENLYKLSDEKHSNLSVYYSSVRRQIQQGKTNDIVDIDYIMWLLSSGREAKDIEKGMMLARDIDCLNAFIWPYVCFDPYATWDNCAQIICEKSDNELLAYFWELMHRLDNMMLPGALSIYDRLLKCDNIDELLEDFEKYPLFDYNDGHYQEVIDGLKSKQSFL